LAKTFEAPLIPALSCQSFPQTMAAVRTGRFWSVVPEMAVRDLPAGAVHRVSDDSLRALAREAMLAWNPRLLRIRPGASKVASALQMALRLGDD
jgi:DNA-binding transcriptional LysR family regulator